MPFCYKNSAIYTKKASGSYNLSIKFPPKINENLPKDLSSLHALPSKNLTFCFN